MAKITLKNNQIAEINKAENISLPKYASQIINLANQNAQGTRKNVVGQMSDLFPEFLSVAAKVSVDAWGNWYTGTHPTSVENATDKIYGQIENLKKAIALIDRDMVRSWVEDLLITKTYNGMYLQEAILHKVAEIKKLPYRKSTAAEESKGIDGYIGGKAYSVKPDTYDSKNMLSEEINVEIIVYKKTKGGISFEVPV